ncbi:hypothetical protein [Nonomuraea sp. NPDC049784]|uniref:hypothetical protein n=1 Tax=Nonomuraea sp. NPDC049784 TaxID=3154361 RepID=UPI00340C2384
MVQRNTDVSAQVHDSTACTVLEVLDRVSGKWAIGILRPGPGRPRTAISTDPVYWAR